MCLWEEVSSLSSYSTILLWVQIDSSSPLSSVQFSRSFVSDSLQHHESKHTRPPCPSRSPGDHSTHIHRVSDASSHLILSRPLLLLPQIPPSIRVFSNEWTLRMRWPKYWSFSFSIIPFKEHPGLISFRMDWLGLFAVQAKSTILQFEAWYRMFGAGALGWPRGMVWGTRWEGVSGWEHVYTCGRFMLMYH